MPEKTVPDEHGHIPGRVFTRSWPLVKALPTLIEGKIRMEPMNASMEGAGELNSCMRPQMP